MFVKREKRLKSEKNIQYKSLVPNPVQINRHCPSDILERFKGTKNRMLCFEVELATPNGIA